MSNSAISSNASNRRGKKKVRNVMLQASLDGESVARLEAATGVGIKEWIKANIGRISEFVQSAGTEVSPAPKSGNFTEIRDDLLSYKLQMEMMFKEFQSNMAEQNRAITKLLMEQSEQQQAFIAQQIEHEKEISDIQRKQQEKISSSISALKKVIEQNHISNEGLTLSLNKVIELLYSNKEADLEGDNDRF